MVCQHWRATYVVSLQTCVHCPWDPVRPSIFVTYKLVLTRLVKMHKIKLNNWKITLHLILTDVYNDILMLLKIRNYILKSIWMDLRIYIKTKEAKGRAFFVETGTDQLGDEVGQSEMICTGFPLKWRKQISGLYRTINTRKSDYCFTINDLLRSFNKKTRFGKCYLKHFLLIYYNCQCREIKLQKLLDHWLGFSGTH